MFNFVNKTTGYEFFTAFSEAEDKDIGKIDFSQNMVFFYPIEAAHGRPMPDDINKALKDNNFEFYINWLGILVYGRRKENQPTPP
jgi:hypothetical protein